MSVTDVQRAFVRGLEGKAACKVAALDYEDGGRMQRLSFHVVSGTYGAAYLSEVIPADMCPMQHARMMAANFLEGRIAGQSQFTVPPRFVPVVRTDAPLEPLAPLPVALGTPPPGGQVAPPVAANDLAPLPASAAPAVVPAQVPAAAPPQGLTDEIAQLDAMSRAGDIAGGIELICRWVDDEAEAVRGTATTGAAGQALEYEQIRREISDLAYRQVKATPRECPCLWASVGVDVAKTGDDDADIRAAAALINARIDATNEFLSRVRAVRIASKMAARAAGTIEGALAVYEGIAWPGA